MEISKWKLANVNWKLNKLENGNWVYKLDKKIGKLKLKTWNWKIKIGKLKLENWNWKNGIGKLILDS